MKGKGLGECVGDVQGAQLQQEATKGGRNRGQKMTYAQEVSSSSSSEINVAASRSSFCASSELKKGALMLAGSKRPQSLKESAYG